MPACSLSDELLDQILLFKRLSQLHLETEYTSNSVISSHIMILSQTCFVPRPSRTRRALYVNALFSQLTLQIRKICSIILLLRVEIVNYPFHFAFVRIH